MRKKKKETVVCEDKRRHLSLFCVANPSDVILSLSPVSLDQTDVKDIKEAFSSLVVAP